MHISTCERCKGKWGNKLQTPIWWNFGNYELTMIVLAVYHSWNPNNAWYLIYLWTRVYKRVIAQWLLAFYNSYLENGNNILENKINCLVWEWDLHNRRFTNDIDFECCWFLHSGALCLTKTSLCVYMYIVYICCSLHIDIVYWIFIDYCK